MRIDKGKKRIVDSLPFEIVIVLKEEIDGFEREKHEL